MTRQMALVGFLQAQNCTNLPSSWRHPESRDDSMSADYYQEIARILEAGKFHMAFFDDRLAMPDRYGNDHAHTVEYGIRCVKMDPIIVLTTMGMVTDKLGLASTCSTTYYEPFDVARRFATLDLMTGGRAAWNVVTSVNDGEALNMGKQAHLEHDLRYDRADEFMEVVLGHWDCWEDGALIIDKKSGRFADPTKVKRLELGVLNLGATPDSAGQVLIDEVRTRVTPAAPVPVPTSPIWAKYAQEETSWGKVTR